MDMSCVQCAAVAIEDDRWIVRFEKEKLGPYLNRDIALQVATAEALRVRRTGNPARVAVIDQNGECCAERCLCEKFQPGC
jgi:hypothetical protein